MSLHFIQQFKLIIYAQSLSLLEQFYQHFSLKKCSKIYMQIVIQLNWDYC